MIMKIKVKKKGKSTNLALPPARETRIKAVRTISGAKTNAGAIDAALEVFENLYINIDSLNFIQLRQFIPLKYRAVFINKPTFKKEERKP